MESIHQRIVIKVGTSTLTAGTAKLCLPQITALAQQVAAVVARGGKIALVSSGAIAVGREYLGSPALPKTIPGKQMLAAIGQPRLMNVYEQLFAIYGLKVAQVLLTRRGHQRPPPLHQRAQHAGRAAGPGRSPHYQRK